MMFSVTHVSHSKNWLKNKCHVSSYQFVLHMLFITSKLAAAFGSMFGGLGPSIHNSSANSLSSCPMVRSTTDQARAWIVIVPLFLLTQGVGEWGEKPSLVWVIAITKGSILTT